MDVTPKQGLGDQTFRNLTLIQLIFESALIGVTAGTTRTQAGATPVVNTEVNRIDTATAPSAGSPRGDGVSMMAAHAGLTVFMCNNTLFNVQLYGAQTASGVYDTINGVSGSAGIIMPPGALYVMVAAATGGWFCDGVGAGASGQYPTVSCLDGLTAAAAGTQAGGVQLVSAMSRFTTVAGAGYSATLLSMKAGMSGIIIINAGVNAMNVFPAVGEYTNGGAVNAAYSIPAGKTATFNCTLNGQSHPQLSA